MCAGRRHGATSRAEGTSACPQKARRLVAQPDCETGPFAGHRAFRHSQSKIEIPARRVGRSSCERFLSGVSKTWTFSRSLHGWIHGVPGKKPLARRPFAKNDPGATISRKHEPATCSMAGFTASPERNLSHGGRSPRTTPAPEVQAPQHFLYLRPEPQGQGSLRSGVAARRTGSRGVRDSRRWQCRSCSMSGRLANISRRSR